MSQPLKITSRGKYAVVALVELGKLEGGQSIRLADIAQHTNISLSYLEQLVPALKRYGFIRGFRGPGGGYTLGADPSNINITDVLIAAEDCVPAKRNANVHSEKIKCVHTNMLWDFIGIALYGILRNITLMDLLQGQFSFEDNPT